jgi:Protein of unknown function (DUF1572)
MSPHSNNLAPAVLSEARRMFSHSMGKIRNCFGQLADEDVRWRPHATHNSIAIIVNHLCGNVRQWIVSGVGGARDVRHRPAEFVDPGPVGKAELLAKLERVVAEADAALAGLDPSRLLEAKRIQGFDVTLLHAILDTASHFVGHTHQIVYITRMRLGDAYQFEWKPATAEQGAE